MNFDPLGYFVGFLVGCFAVWWLNRKDYKLEETKLVETIGLVSGLRADSNKLRAILTKIVNEWDQYFDAEGPDDDGYRWSSITTAGVIEEAKLLLKDYQNGSGG